MPNRGAQLKVVVEFSVGIKGRSCSVHISIKVSRFLQEGRREGIRSNG